MGRVRFAVTALLIVAATTFAQSPPDLGSDDRVVYNQLRGFSAPVEVAGDAAATARNRKVLADKAKYIVGQLTDKRRSEDTYAQVIQNLVQNELPRPVPPRPADVEKFLAFSREMGPALVKELEPALKDAKLLVRLNSARLLSIVGMFGYEGAAELALKILEDPKESEGVKFYALQTLANLFEFVPEPAVPEVTVFDQGASGQIKAKNRELRNKAVTALCEYVVKPRDVAGMNPDEVAAVTYVRREAVRALGQVRTHRLRDGAPPQVLARPGLVLLKVANKDGITPEPDIKEQAEAVIGFCNLFPVIRAGADREVQCDYAADVLGHAINDIANVKLNVINDTRLPWKHTAERLDAALTAWQTNVAGMRLDGAEAAKALAGQVQANLLGPLKANQPGVVPNTNAVRVWLGANKPKAKFLYKDEPGTQLKAIGG